MTRRRIRVATYNIHKCIGMDRRILPGRIADVVAEVRPDVIGMQEVLSFPDGPREQNVAQFLADKLGMHLAVGEVRRLRGGAYGNIVLSRYPLRNVCTYDLSVPGRERRGCVRTDVDLGDGCVLYVFNFHLGTDLMERRWQARKIVTDELIRSRNLVGPRVALGDFNEWTRGHVSTMLAAEFRTADIRLHLRQKRTYPGILPVMHLDHIYYDEDLIPERVVLHRTLKSLVASDHLPLFADFALRGCGTPAEESQTALHAPTS